MNSKKSDRRGFLKGSAALAGLAVGAVPFANGKALASVTDGLINGGEATTKLGGTPDEPTIQDLAYGGRSRFESTERMNTGSRLGLTGLRNVTPLQDSIGIITPASLHFMVMRDLHLPNIDPR